MVIYIDVFGKGNITIITESIFDTKPDHLLTTQADSIEGELK